MAQHSLTLHGDPLHGCGISALTQLGTVTAQYENFLLL